jgi:hypothetical protein
MTVSFAEELETVNKIIVNKQERQEKKETYRKIKKNLRGKSFLARILYAPYQREHQYVDLKMKGKKPINCIANNSYDSDYTHILYKERKMNIKYKIFQNENGMLVLDIETRGLLGERCYKEYYRMGCDLEDMYVAEYRAKTELIRRVRKICEDNNIY